MSEQKKIDFGANCNVLSWVSTLRIWGNFAHDLTCYRKPVRVLRFDFCKSNGFVVNVWNIVWNNSSGRQSASNFIGKVLLVRISWEVFEPVNLDKERLSPVNSSNWPCCSQLENRKYLIRYLWTFSKMCTLKKQLRFTSFATYEKGHM